MEKMVTSEALLHMETMCKLFLAGKKEMLKVGLEVLKTLGKDGTRN